MHILTEREELEALEKIKAIVEDLGPSSYLAFTLAGVLELAEENIKNDLYRNPIDHIKQLKERLSDDGPVGSTASEEHANALLAEMGYKLSKPILVEEIHSFCGKRPLESKLDMFAAMAPHIVLAYQQGVSGKSLAEFYPFLIPQEGPHEQTP